MTKKALSLILALLMFVSTFSGLELSVFASNDDYETDPTPLLTEGWNYNKNNDAWYYVKDGKLYSGWIKLKGVWYYLNPNDNIMLENTVSLINGKYYYFKSSGAMAGPGWVKDVRYGDYAIINGKKYYDWFYADSNGALVTGWNLINNVWYYFINEDDTAPYMYWGSVEQIGNYYYMFGLSGNWISKPGWQSINWGDTVDWCYLNNKGRCRTSSWLHYKNAWYYFSDWGYMIKSDVCNINGKFYAFSNNGKLREKKGWFSLKYSNETEWFYTKEDGSCYTGWVRVNGTWYYFDLENASMYSSGTYDINGVYYSFDDNGAWMEN